MFKKFFGVSLPRTGTSSLYNAMRILKFHGKHYMDERGYQNVGWCKFANDYPISIRYKELDEKYPYSGFIYPDRPVEAWLDSYDTHWKRTGHLTIGDWDKWNMEVFGTLTFDRDLFRDAFLKHREEVFEYFKGRDDFLVLDMPYTDDAWSQLCRFTGVLKPTRSFPNVNGSYAKENPWCPRNEVQR